MNKTFLPNSAPKIPLHEEWNGHPAIEWLLNHKNFLLGVLAGVVVLLLFSSRLMNWKSVENEKEYVQAEILFAAFQKSALDPKEGSILENDFAQLDAIMKRHPDLKSKYEGALAQTLLISDRIPQAKMLIEDIVKRTEPDHLQLYQAYTQASVLVAEKKYTEALALSNDLKLKLEALPRDLSSNLFTFNLIRLALLYQQLNQPNEELQIWGELLSKTENMAALLSIGEILRIGEASFSQYIEERKKEIVSAIRADL